MSSFLCGSNDFDVLASMLSGDFTGITIYQAGLRDCLKRSVAMVFIPYAVEHGYLEDKPLHPMERMHELEDPEVVTEIIRDMIWLNYYALHERYGDKLPDRSEIVYYPHIVGTTPIQAHKTLSCLSYQCAEGDAVETDLYKRILEAKRRIADCLITHTPEWDEAEWSLEGNYDFVREW